MPVGLLRVDAIRYLTELVRVPSPSGREDEVAGLIKEFLSEAGVDTVIIDRVGNVIAKVRGGGCGSVLIEGHMDVVDPGNPRNWHVDPYSAKVIDGMLYGRGSADMKGGIAAQIASASKFGELDIDIYFVYTGLEEAAEGVTIAETLSGTLKNVEFSVAVTGEATGLDLGVGHRGRALIEVVIEGVSAHASMPEEGVNALVGASRHVMSLMRVSPHLPKHQVLGKESATPTLMTCMPPDTPQIPDKCVVVYDHRLIVGRGEGDVLETYLGACRNVREAGDYIACSARIREEVLRTWTGVELDVKDFFNAWLNEDLRLVKEMLGRLKKVRDRTSRHVWKFSTDLAYVSGKLGVPGFGLGPGDERVAHKPDEHVPLAEVVKAVDMYVALVKSLNKVLPGRVR